MKTVNDIFGLEGKTALVTGAAQGIGAACAEALAREGAKVMLTDILEEQGQQTAAAIRLTGAEAEFLRHDVTDEAQWESTVAATIERFGGLDVVVNNAGIEIVHLIMDLPLETWRKIQKVNVEGVFLGTKHAMLAMRPGGKAGKGGSIINMSSLAGITGSAMFSAYCASKGAVRTFSKAAAAEGGALGIRVNSVHPGFVRTEMGKAAISHYADIAFGGDSAQVEAFFTTTRCPLGRLGEPWDVAAPVLFLASDLSRYVTGTELIVDGGTHGAS